MRRRHAFWVGALALLASFPLLAATAAATPVLVFDHGRVHRTDDRFLPATRLPRAPGPAVRARQAAAPAGAFKAALRGLFAARVIDQVEHDKQAGAYDGARAAAAQLSGTRRRELQSVVNNADHIAADGLLSGPRLYPVYLMLERNREWWTSAPVPARGERVRFAPSLLIYEYYPGEGLQLQPLGNWGKVNGYLNGGYPDAARILLAQLIPLGVPRAGGPAWEYYFFYGGGRPPWISSLSQGTAVQALVQASKKLNNRSYLQTASAALRAFEAAAPTGLRVRGRRGSHYLIYSFAPRLFVLNSFAQTLNGLYDAGSPRLGNLARARRLFRAGDRQLRFELPRYDTGRFSRYALGGGLASRHYHTLARDFLRGLCRRTGARVYCSTATRYTRYLHRR